MSNQATFKDYVTRHCREKLLNAVAAFIAKKYSPTPVALADITVQSAKAGALNELGVSFVMLVGATIRHTDTPEPAPRETVCLQMEGQVDLAQGPESLEITAVSQRTEMNVTYNQLLSDRLLPVIPKADLDRVADWMLRHYYPEALGEPMPVNPYVFAERVGAAVEERRLSPDSSVFGRIYFDDADSGIKAGTIYVDPEANYSYRGGNTATSIIHECVHWGLHRRAFAFRRLLSDSAPDLSCVSDSDGAKGQESDISLMEWQANALAPRIQMPLGTFRRQAEATIARLRQETPAEDLLDIIEQVIDELARIYQVSRIAAKIRMVEAGYQEAIGAYIYIDGRYVTPHLVDPKRVRGDQTYCIGLHDAAQLSLVSPEFRDVTSSGAYRYVDSHFVRDHPLYVTAGPNGGEVLTDYALMHMEECCLLFDVVRPENGQQHEEPVLCLNSDQERPVSFTFKYGSGYQNTTDENELVALVNREYMEELWVYSILPNTLAEALTVVIKWRHHEKKVKGELEKNLKRLGLSERTYRRLVKGEGGKVEDLCNLMLDLNLPPMISSYLLDIAPYKLDPKNKTHMWYRFALTYWSKDKYDDIRKKVELYANLQPTEFEKIRSPADCPEWYKRYLTRATKQLFVEEKGPHRAEKN